MSNVDSNQYILEHTAARISNDPGMRETLSIAGYTFIVS